MRLVGTNEHSLDPKGRIVLPAVYRPHLADRCYVTFMGDRIGIYSEEAFDQLVDQLEKRTQDGELTRLTLINFTSNVVEVKLDTAGRVTLPRNLLEAAGLKEQARIIGAVDHIEIWDAELAAEVFDSVEARGKVSSIFN